MKGLLNLGNSCYFNTALQCMLQVPQLSNFMIMKKFSTSCEFTREYQRLTRKMWIHKMSKFENPKDIFNIFKNIHKQFNNSDQQDSHEVIMCILDTLDKSLKPEGTHSIIRDIFYGKMIQEVVTPEQKTKSFEDTTCLMIFLNHNTTIEKCLCDYTKWNFLDNYKDDNGKFQTVTTTRCTFWNTPYILIISFKMYTGKYRVKLSHELDLTPWVHPDTTHKCKRKYKLFATCTHQGSTRSGHYVSHVLHHDRWYMKDDESVTETPVPLDGYHYVVFYKLFG